ncbi:MAG: molybdopterin-dependent oxidoreductase [Burkholderiales bacterium]|nr:molybdopterin-dependent oxidoreductase [Burkholderiales bacterium]
MDQSADQLVWHKSACNLCYLNCGVELGVKGSGQSARIVKVRGDRDNPRSRGYLCNKAQAIPDYVHHRDRLTTPLRRRADGSYEAIDWDTAIREIAGRLRTILDQHGGKTLALFGGGGQGNHAGGAYANPFLRALGSRTVFSAIAQEKTGDFWVNGHMFGSQICQSAEDIHHCDLLLVIGANPRIAHGFTNAREQLNDIRKDPSRKLVVVDPRRTETAAAADLHLALRPGTDAFLMGALLAELAARDGLDERFLSEHTVGAEEVKAALSQIPVARWLEAADVSRADFDTLVELVMAARSMVVRVELGIQQGRNSTLNSYLEKLLFLMTGNFGREGTNLLHGWLVPLWGNTPGKRYEPTGAEVIAGLLSPNVFPDAVFSEHPDHLRAVWVDSSNPVNTAADTGRFLQALKALELVVVVDVAFTETAAQAHYVLPASSQYEKCEFTLFNFEAPVNYFHVRAPVLEPLAGTLPEPEIYTRLARELGLLPDDETMSKLAAAATDMRGFGAAFAEFMSTNPGAATIAPILLFNTLGRHLPDGTAAAAFFWAASARLAKSQTDAVRRALSAPDSATAGALGAQLFDALIRGRSGIAFSDHSDVWSLVEHPDRKIRLAIPSLLDWLRALDPDKVMPDPAWPFVLSAGERRLQNTNQIQRDPAFRRADPDGALYINPNDLAALGGKDNDRLIVESNRAHIVVRAKATDSMRRGHVSLPHGYGQSHPDARGTRVVQGPAINWLTDLANRDPIADTPYHKFVPVQLRIAGPSDVVGSIRQLASVPG